MRSHLDDFPPHSRVAHHDSMGFKVCIATHVNQSRGSFDDQRIRFDGRFGANFQQVATAEERSGLLAQDSRADPSCR